MICHNRFSISTILSRFLAVSLTFAIYHVLTIAAAPFQSYNWYTDYSQALQQAQATKSPIMMVATMSGCPACENLKKSFSSASPAKAEKFDAIAAEYVLLHYQNVAPPKNVFAVAGHKYVPRVMFTDSNGVLQPQVKNDKKPKTAYFYGSITSLTQAMEQAYTGLIEE